MGAGNERLKGESGFTLVEVMIAMVVLLMVALAVAPMFVMGAKNQSRAQSGVLIHNYARQQIEAKISDLKAGGQAAWPSVGSNSPLYASSDPRFVSTTTPKGNLTGQFSYSSDTIMPEAGNTMICLRVTLSLTYTDPSAGTGNRSIILKRVISPGV